MTYYTSTKKQNVKAVLKHVKHDAHSDRIASDRINGCVYLGQINPVCVHGGL